LPFVIRDFIPVGLVGLLLAGLLAAFMSTFDSTVNAGAAYIVNDIYKRYINPDAAQRRYVVMGYFASIGLVIVGVILAMQVSSIDDITKWITFALFGGYAVPNILKWHWWRFNGYGYFAGMITGVVAAIALKTVNELGQLGIPDGYAFFITAPPAAIASVAVSLMTPPDDMDVLKKFYHNVRPWGFWDPVYEALREDHPEVVRNTDFKMDMFNVAIGIVWQLMLIVMPVALVIRQWDLLAYSVGVCAATSIIMKFTWWDRLDRFNESPETHLNAGN